MWVEAGYIYVYSVAAASRLIELVMDNYAQHKCLSELSACPCVCVCVLLNEIKQLLCTHKFIRHSHVRTFGSIEGEQGHLKNG